ncbi:Catechol O-methyltransferase [Acipenser ruthenus]|uniref:catechol O-methyltransferase n=1 Tax=Acipenser ruthenus TaxID=7906 RepID=A0A444TXE6_ACIRT|nr:Catechol O-methyltransferase [Acipenser ruthenus]
MLLLVVCVAACVALLWYTLVFFVIPALVQYNGTLALLWHDVIVERSLDWLTRSTRPQRLLTHVKQRARRGDAQSVITTIDDYCRAREWAMNVGDEKGSILDQVVCEVSPDVALELGTYCGYSSVRIARLLPPGARLLTVEFNHDYATVAREVVCEVSPDVALELGTYCGYSSVRIARLLPPGARLLTVEFNHDYATVAREVQLLEGASGDLIPQLRQKHGIETLDFIFLDHWKDRYLPDTRLLENPF